MRYIQLCLLPCLACVNHGRRVQTTIEESRANSYAEESEVSVDAVRNLKVLSRLVLALSASVAFKPSMSAALLPPSKSTLTPLHRCDAPSREVLQVRHKAAVMNFLAFFVNPLDLLAPSTGPISAEKGNFALVEHPNLVILNEDPPVYEIPGFLSEIECAELVVAAEGGAFPQVPYGRKNKIFTGTKWAASGTTDVEPFLEKSQKLFGGVGKSRFEPVTVTRYSEGEYQAKHLDARLPHEFARNEAHWRTGGQRIAQVIVYLQEPVAGGSTKFFNPAFKNLEVKPETGKALVFPTCDLDGQADERYLHSGEPVEVGDKYIVGTWLMERNRKDAKDIEKAMKELWKLQRQRDAA